MRHGRKLRPSKERWTRHGERRPDGGCGSKLKSPSCANVACSKTRKVTTRWPAKKARGEHGSTTGCEIALRDNCAVDLERGAPQWWKRHRDQSGTEKIRVARIDAVATIPGSNELQWLDVAIRRPTALTNMEGSARMGGHAATQGEREETKKYGNRNEVGPDTVKPISIELGGRMGLRQSVCSKT